jgi:hypothetical protein
VAERGRRLLIHAIEGAALGDGIGGSLSQQSLDALSRRALLLAREDDTVVVDGAMDPGWAGFVRSLGLGTDRVEVARGGDGSLMDRVLGDGALLDRVRGGSVVVEPYMGSVGATRLGAALGVGVLAGDPGLVATLNLKSSLPGVMERAGVPMIDSRIVARDGVLGVVAEMQREGDVIVRADVSIGGFGVWMIRGGEGVEALGRGLARSGAERLFTVQRLLDVDCSPNVQYRCGEDGLVRVGVSDQRMTAELAFVGNSWPSVMGDDAGMLDQAARIAEVLVVDGYRGYVGIDFIRTREGAVFAIEINPRVNTSTFALEVGRRLGAGAFVLATGVGVGGAMGFDRVARALGGDLYDAGSGRGVVPMTLPSAARGAMDLMVFAETLDEAREIGTRAQRALTEEGACARA